MSILLFRKKKRGTPAAAVATHLGFTTAPGLSGASPYTLSPQPVVAAQKNDNTTDTSKAGTVVFSLDVLSGSPVLSGTTSKALSSGVATATDLVVTGAGTWTITASLTGLASATSSTGTTTASGAQFTETWSTNSIRSTLWATTLSGTGAASAATGALVLTMSAGGSAQVGQPGSSTNRYDLTTAGALADGVTADITGLGTTGARFYYAIVGSDGKGWAFHFESSTFSWAPVSAGSGTIESRLGTAIDAILYDASAHRHLRFRKVSGNLEVNTSADGSSWSAPFGTTNATAIGTETVTTMGIVFEVDAASAVMSATIGTVVFS